MKTAISLPDDTFDRGERAAKRLGVSRSELYARALDSYVARLERQTVTARLDAALDRTGHDEDTTRAVVDTGRAVVANGEDDW